MGGLIFLVDYLSSMTPMEEHITRNSYGKGSKIESFDVKLENESEKIPVELEISEQNYSSEEVQELFARVIRRMESLILAENKSLDHVEKNLNLLAEVPDEPVDISWELDRYDVMNVKGEIQKEALKEETLVKLSAVLTYREDEKEQALYQCVVKVCPAALTKEEENSKEMKEELQKQEERQREDKILSLPSRIGGQAVTYYKRMDQRGVVIMLMGLLIGGLLCALQRQNQAKESEQRQQQMMLDYPEIMNKITLFLGAGMTVKRAWKKVVEDYEQQKPIWGSRYAYEEMKKTCYEMESGVTGAESYENFGRRCNVQVYVRFGALLSQNLRKGMKGLTQMLKLESIQAFEERKARAKKLGEEAGTKLLFPMFLMLAVVLIIVIVPAFMSLQI